MSLAQSDRDLRQVVQEEVGEVLTGEHHNRFHLGFHRTLSDALQGAEESIGLVARRGLPIGRHHRCMGGGISHHEVCHRVFLLVSLAARASSGR